MKLSSLPCSPRTSVSLTVALCVAAVCIPPCFAADDQPAAAAAEKTAQESIDDGKLRIICFGAHPDDAEYKSGGTAALWASLGHHVKLVSVTNGDIGHWQMAGGPLAKRRTAESAEVAKRLGSHRRSWISTMVNYCQHLKTDV